MNSKESHPIKFGKIWNQEKSDFLKKSDFFNNLRFSPNSKENSIKFGLCLYNWSPNFSLEIVPLGYSFKEITLQIINYYIYSLPPTVTVTNLSKFKRRLKASLIMSKVTASTLSLNVWR